MLYENMFLSRIKHKSMCLTTKFSQTFFHLKEKKKMVYKNMFSSRIKQKYMCLILIFSSSHSLQNIFFYISFNKEHKYFQFLPNDGFCLAGS